AGAGLLAVAAVFQIVDALQVISSSLLRGLKDTRRPMWIAVLSYWGLGVPSAYILGFVLDFGGQGVWGGLAIGLTAAAVLLTWRFMRRDALGLMQG
ncbi:MAG: MATE family efflux transporter, partial [Pseudomonadota bacterium]